MTTKKVVVRVPQWLGDAVVSTIFLTRLKNRNPESDIFVLTPFHLKPLFDSHPSVKEVVAMDRSQKDVFSVSRRLRSFSFDEIYILPRSFRTALEAKLAGVPRRVGFSGDGRGWLLTNPQPYEPHHQYAHRYLKLIGEENVPLTAMLPLFPVAEPGSSERCQTLGRFLGKVKTRVLGLAPASVAPARTWSAQNFLELANQFQKKGGGPVVLFGSENEKDVTTAIKNGINGPVIDTAGELTLPELGWAIKQCAALVANDSGLMHVASCFRIPTVILFGASDPTWALPPWGRCVAIQKKEIPCAPCLRNACVRFGSYKNECLTRISVSDAMTALTSVLN